MWAVAGILLAHFQDDTHLGSDSTVFTFSLPFLGLLGLDHSKPSEHGVNCTVHTEVFTVSERKLM